MNNKIIIGVVVVLVLIVGGWWVFAPKSIDTSPGTDFDTVEIDDGEDTTVSIIEDVMDGSGDELAVAPLERATLSAVGSYTGTGLATRRWDGTTFEHTVTAQIGDPAPGKFYEGWIVNMALTPKFISTGKMTKHASGYGLEYSINRDYTDYNTVVITEETEVDGLDNKPEAHVLEGSF